MERLGTAERAGTAEVRPATTRWTRLVLTAGTLAAGACLLVGLLLRMAGAPAETGNPADPGAVIGALVALRPWGWSTLGVALLLLTPVAGLVATFVELRRDEGRVAWLTVAVLAVLGLAVAIALR